MSQLVVNNALCTCTFGTAPSAFSVLPTKMTNGAKQPIAVITDTVPMLNVKPFAMCTSIANPTVASATAAALGVLTPMPCVPVIPAPWTPGKPMVNIKNTPALDKDSMCNCAWGGVIKFSMPGQFTVDAK